MNRKQHIRLHLAHGWYTHITNEVSILVQWGICCSIHLALDVKASSNIDIFDISFEAQLACQVESNGLAYITGSHVHSLHQVYQADWRLVGAMYNTCTDDSFCTCSALRIGLQKRKQLSINSYTYKNNIRLLISYGSLNTTRKRRLCHSALYFDGMI